MGLLERGRRDPEAIRRSIDQAIAAGRCHRLVSVWDAELLEDILEVPFDGFERDADRERDLLIRHARRDQAHNFRFAGSPHRCTRRRPRAIGIGAPGKVLNELLDIACEFRVGPIRGRQAMKEVQHLLPPVDNRADKAQLGAAKQRCAKMFGRPIGSGAGLVDPGSQEIDCDERRLATEPLCLRRDPVELGESRWIVAFEQRDARARAAGDVRGESA